MKIKRINKINSANSFKYTGDPDPTGMGEGALRWANKYKTWQDVYSLFIEAANNSNDEDIESEVYKIYQKGKGLPQFEKAYSVWMNSADTEEGQWEEVASKQVMDSDGFLTDYTMYTNGETYICMFGDKDLYEPDSSYADYETEDEKNAWDWFNTYEGFADDFDGDEDYDIYSSQEVDDSEDDLDHPDQEFDSADTSINSNKLPAVYRMIKIPEGTVGVDFGGGRFDNAVEHIRDLGATLCVYDPYNRSAEHNREVIKTLRANRGADWAINSNVLNVIKEGSARKAVLENISKITKSGAPIYITVYEGRGDGKDGPTKAGYQLNRKTADYLEEVQEVFPDAVRKGKLIIAHNSRSVNSATAIQAASLWMGKYVTPDNQIHKVYFEYNTNSFYKAEKELKAIIPEPYVKCRLLGSAPSEKLLKADGFKLISPRSVNSATDFDILKKLQSELNNKLHQVMTELPFGFLPEEVDEYSVVEVTTEEGRIKAEVRAELDYDGLFELCEALNPIVEQYDKDSYFEPVEPGIIEAFIRTNVEACSNVTASASNQFTMQDVQALIDDYGTKYFEAIPISGGRELWFSVFDVGSYDICIEDGKIIMISTDDPNDDVRIFRSLEDFRNYLEKQIAIGKQEMDMNYSANASTLVTSSLNYVTPEMKQLKRAISKIYVDNDDQFHKLVDSLLINEPINLVPETKALKRAIDSLVVDSEEERRTLVYEVAKDLGVINSSSNVDVYSAASSANNTYDERMTVSRGGQKFSVHYNHVDNSPSSDAHQMWLDFQASVSLIAPYDDADYAWAQIENGHINVIKGNKVIQQYYYLDADDMDVENSEWCDAIIEQAIDYISKINDKVEQRIIHNSKDTEGQTIEAGIWDVPEPNLDPPEYDEPTEEDPFTEYFDFYFDSVIIMDKDGGWDYENDDYSFAANPDNKQGDWRTDEDNIYVTDTTGMVEYFDEMIEPMMPADPGRYRIEGYANMAFDISGVEAYYTYYRDGSYDRELVENGGIDAEFNFKESEIKDFKYTKLD